MTTRNSTFSEKGCETMDGVFLRGRFLKLQNILGLVCGIILALMFGFFNFVGAYETLGDRLASWVFVIFGLFVAALCAVSLYVNKRLFIRVEGERITGYCQFGLSLDCALEDVKSVSYGGTGLNLRLKNGKSYNLMNLENACQLGCYIEKRLPREALPEEDEETILARLAPLGKRRLKTGLGFAACLIWTFASIFVCGALTGWRELHQFSGQDWVIFWCMAATGVLALAGFGILLRIHVLDTEKQNKLQGQLHQRILRTAPLRPGNVRQVFLDDELHGSCRVTVYGIPNSGEVYFTVEAMDADRKLQCVHESPLYPDYETLEPELEGLCPIPIPTQENAH